MKIGRLDLFLSMRILTFVKTFMVIDLQFCSLKSSSIICLLYEKIFNRAVKSQRCFNINIFFYSSQIFLGIPFINYCSNTRYSLLESEGIMLASVARQQIALAYAEITFLPRLLNHPGFFTPQWCSWPLDGIYVSHQLFIFLLQKE